MIALQVLREVSDACDGINHYGAGPKHYLNAQDRISGKSSDDLYPLCWIYDLGFSSKLGMGPRDRTYSVIGIIGRTLTAGLGASQEEIEDALSTLGGIVDQFEQKLQVHDAFDPEFTPNFICTPIVYEYDLALCGWVFTFNMKLKEAYPVNCDPITTVLRYVADGSVNPGYVEEQ